LRRCTRTTAALGVITDDSSAFFELIEQQQLRQEAAARQSPHRPVFTQHNPLFATCVSH
jgi:hypothetical protein